MVILDVFTKNIKITYKSTLLSKAALLVFIFGLISVVLPFIFAYKSKGLWIKRDVFYEQPDVKFKGEYIFLATTNNISNPVITCSVLPDCLEKLEFLNMCPLIKVREIDKNFDSKVDELNLNLQVNLPSGTQLTSVYVIFPLDYKLHVCPLQMQAAIVFQTFLPVPISKFTVVADLIITQSTSLVCHNNKINNFYNYSVIANEEVSSHEINSIIMEYSKRNISTTLKNIYTSFVPGNTQNFILNIDVRYAEDKVYYKPGLWQILKWAWIQYLAIYLIVSWLVTKIKSYIFSKRLVLFYEDNPLKKKQ